MAPLNDQAPLPGPALAVRQQAFRSGTQALTVVIAEAALLQLVGGRAVMRAQLTHLASLPDEGRVLVHLLPFGALGRPAPGLGSMTILHLGPAPAITVAYLAENLRRALKTSTDRADRALKAIRRGQGWGQASSQRQPQRAARG